MKVASLFAGIGGVPLAASWVGWTPTWVAEVDPYCKALLQQNFPGVPNFGDVRAITGTAVPHVDVLTGGFPCQDISFAGRGAGLAGERSGLWTEFHRLIAECRPRYALIENVSALRSRGLDTVLADLVAIGYDAEWHCIPASHVGAPHQRDRIWIVAWPRDPDTDGARLEGWLGTRVSECAREWAAGTLGASQPWQGPAAGWWGAEPDVGRVADGVPKRVDRLKGLGNSCVPIIPALIFAAIERWEREQLVRW